MVAGTFRRCLVLGRGGSSARGDPAVGAKGDQQLYPPPHRISPMFLQI
jgi:hypothetical protein